MLTIFLRAMQLGGEVWIEKGSKNMSRMLITQPTLG